MCYQSTLRASAQHPVIALGSQRQILFNLFACRPLVTEQVTVEPVTGEGKYGPARKSRIILGQVTNEQDEEEVSGADRKSWTGEAG